ncbi:hypothetical protein HZI73_18190 [Vallitalea pronyensis]|uniref:Uncharacterized protein n=1 Tax=Vallitalea pronyensis TaxID=1348613 RepID=A0A8J8SI55_9FIRM|nr:hypothetical protein [Vallitalea pronyensis]QUI24104.1 hypothetical protein HZI73_18190 [Vallitalea pronyensis]
MESIFKGKPNEIVMEEKSDISEDTILQGSQIFGSLVQTKHLANIIKRSKWINGTIIENHARTLTPQPFLKQDQNDIDSRICLNYNAWVKGLTVLDEHEKQTMREIENNENLKRIADGIEALNHKLDHVAKDLDLVTCLLLEDDCQLLETLNQEEKEKI